MAAPTLSDSDQSAWSNSTTPKTVTVDIQSGDVIVVAGSAEDNGATFSTPTNDGAALSWTQEQQIDTASDCRIAIFTAIGDSTRTLVITCATTGGKIYGVAANVWRGSDGVGNSAATPSGDTTADFSVGITTTEDNSALDVVTGDWAAISGARTYLTSGVGAFTEQTNFTQGGAYTVTHGYHADAGTAGAKTVGCSAPSGQDLMLAVVEILGGTGGEPPPVEPTLDPMRGKLFSGRPTAFRG